MEYNHYDLLEMRINGNPINGRPIAFDDSLGIIIPTKVSTICPDCGQGLEFDVDLGEPPWPSPMIIPKNCYLCNPEPEESPDPFVNPLDTGRIAPHELDPLLHNPDNQVINDDLSVSVRLGKGVAVSISEVLRDVHGEASDKKGAENTQNVIKDQEEPKKIPQKAPQKALKKPSVGVAGGIIAMPLEPVSDLDGKGMGAEVDFDDDDMVEE